MSTAKQRLVKSWLVKAHRDLSTARRLVGDAEPYLDTAIYHCQQAAEKAVKAVLVFHDQRFDKTHDVRALISLAVSFAPRLSEWLDVGERLTPYQRLTAIPVNPWSQVAKNSIGLLNPQKISMPSFCRYCLRKFTHESQKHRNPER